MKIKMTSVLAEAILDMEEIAIDFDDCPFTREKLMAWFELLQKAEKYLKKDSNTSGSNLD